MKSALLFLSICLQSMASFAFAANTIKGSFGYPFLDTGRIPVPAPIMASGCTDPSACNFDIDATEDDGSCTYVCNDGCTMEGAYNYNPNAVNDDGSCITLPCGYEGPLVVSFAKAPNANYLLAANQDRITDGFWMTRKTTLGIYNIATEAGYNVMAEGPAGTSWKWGNTDAPGSYVSWKDAIYSAGGGPNIKLTNDNVMSLKLISLGWYFNVTWHSWGVMGPAGGPFSYTRQFDTALSNCEPVQVIPGCTDPEACNYHAYSNMDDASCFFAAPNRDCSCQCLNDNDNDGVCDEEEVLGCTDWEAINFDPQATDDSGLCIEKIFGCTDPASVNYNPAANADNGSCDFNTYGCTYPNAANYSPVSTADDGSCEFGCSSDINSDGLINAGDLLEILADFGTLCP